MSDPEEVSMEELAGLMTAPELVKEATAPRTVPKGWYRVRVDEIKTERDNRENAPIPGRVVITLVGDQFTLDGEKRGKAFIRVSPEPHRVEGKQDPTKSYQDGPTKLWGQAYKAVTDPGEELPANEVLGRIRERGVLDVFVDEYMKMPDQTFARPKNAEERTRLLEEGGEVGNSISSLRRPK